MIECKDDNLENLDSEKPLVWRFGFMDVLWIVLLLVIGGLCWLPGLGQRGLWTSGEARAAQVARRMVAAGDYVTQRLQMNEPHLTVASPAGKDALTYDPDGETVVYEHEWRQQLLQHMSSGALKTDNLRPEIPYTQKITIHKPIFYYWLIGLAHRLGMDVNAFTVRCFSAGPAMLLLVVTYLLGCVLYERRVGLLAAVALATCVQFWWQARICQMDMLLALMMTSAFLLWYVGDRSTRGGTRFAAFSGVYLLLAAASLMKSFAYLLLVALIILVFLAVETIVQHERRDWLRAYGRRIRQVMRRMHVFLGASVYLLLVVPWFVLIHLATDGQYTREMFLLHMFSRAGLINYGREFEATTDWWFYLVRIWVDLFPWVIMIPGAIVQVFRARCRSTWRSGAYLLTWFSVWFVFFSAMHFRKNEYILALYPAAMLLAAKMLVDFTRDQMTDIHLGRAIRAAFVGLAIGITAADACALALMNERFLDWVLRKLGTNRNDAIALNATAEFCSNHLVVTVVVLVLLVAVMIAATILVHRKRAGASLALLTAGTAVMLIAGMNILVNRVIDPRRTQRPFAERLNDAAQSFESTRGKQIVLFGTEQHELVYLLPNRFDSVPWVKPCASFLVDPLFMLRSRIAAETTPTLVVMEREHWDMILGEARHQAKTNSQNDPLIDRFSEVPLDLGTYNASHRELLVLLRFDPEPSGPGTRPTPASPPTT